ncbi:MAG: sulfotransferase [Litorilituus sp.]|nr:sulfotransferase [Litorilituus sp.]
MSKILQANQLFQQGRLTEAEQIYRELLRTNPKDIDALWGLGKVALALDSYRASYDIFTRCVNLVANVPQLWLSLASACERLKRYTEAEQALVRAVELNPVFLPSLQAIAVFYCQSNQRDIANKYLDDLIKIHPENCQAFALKVRIKSQLDFDDYTDYMLEKVKGNSNCLNSQEQILLHYAFAQLFQQAGKFKEAFFHFQQANDTQRSLVTFSVADMQSYFACLIDTFSIELLTRFSSPAVSQKTSLTPIFIVGQPRSGSTLLEHMLSAHSDIDSAGELPFIAGDIAQGIAQLTGQEFPFACQKLTIKQCELLGQHYLKNMQTIAPNANFIIDKMPANYQSIGLIKIILPQAKVIHISRDAKDVTWSIFSNYFEANEPYFCSFEEIAQYHQNYQQIMAHWQKVLPEFFHSVSYDILVKNPQEVLSKVLAFCGLTYQTSCLDFAQQEGYVATLSDVQLREGLQAKRTKAWKNYEALLPICFHDLI